MPLLKKTTYFTLLISFVAINAQCAEIKNLKKFDNLITKDLVASGFEKKIPLSFKIVDQGNIRSYESNYIFSKKDAAEHYTSLINVSPSGTYLSPKQYNKRYNEFKKKYADRGEEYLSQEFPNIGLRAQQEIFGFGPGGAGFGLTFTTSDGMFDIRIIVSSLLNESIEDPNFNIERTARKISDMYDLEIISNKSKTP